MALRWINEPHITNDFVLNKDDHFTIFHCPLLWKFFFFYILHFLYCHFQSDLSDCFPCFSVSLFISIWPCPRWTLSEGPDTCQPLPSPRPLTSTLSAVMTLAKKGASPHSFLKILPLPDLLLKPAFASWVSTAWGYTSVSSSLEILQMCMTVLYKKRVCITLPRLNGLLILYWSEANLQNLFNFEKLHPVIFMAQNIQNNRGVHCSLIREITYLRKGQTIFFFFFRFSSSLSKSYKLWT